MNLCNIVRALRYLDLCADVDEIWKWWNQFPDMFDFIEVHFFVYFLVLFNERLNLFRI